ncbi:phenylalanine--tRNA ligase subunit alpha [Candidatus Falkowbacteria bacterium]|nr:phenylalanine--tRNA ligase subunit alpha [Candidatus Falkowbacteria bacterium]MBT4433181.1 phenylalanine--tRNA ligase subunit alpha [Candidatus Falkowbacteria bacterium]
MIQQLNKIEEDAAKSIESVNSLEELKQFKVKFLARKSEFTAILRSLKDLSKDDRKEVGQKTNEIKQKINESVKLLEKNIKSNSLGDEIDITAPGVKIEEGHLHLTTQAIREIKRIFERIGFYTVKYPEVEWDWYAFGALNFPSDHPARDEWETFFIDKEDVDPKYKKRILTPHTSAGQVREMETGRMPIRMMNISKCPRRQLDVSHVLIHYQFEGLVIDKDITIVHLKGVLDYFVKEFFGPKRKVRIRPYHFRFTEPSFEIDVSCGSCNGKGCRLCKEGWLEIGGAGMVHPKVLENGGIDPEVYSGFAFGWGVERNKIMQEGINIKDIRIIYQNDIRFLKQF